MEKLCGSCVKGDVAVAALMAQNSALACAPCFLLGSCCRNAMHSKHIEHHRSLMQFLKGSVSKDLGSGDVLAHFASASKGHGAGVDHYMFIPKHIWKPSRSIIVLLTPCPMNPGHFVIASRSGFDIRETMSFTAELIGCDDVDWHVYLPRYRHIGSNVVELMSANINDSSEPMLRRLSTQFEQGLQFSVLALIVLVCRWPVRACKQTAAGSRVSSGIDPLSYLKEIDDMEDRPNVLAGLAPCFALAVPPLASQPKRVR